MTEIEWINSDPYIDAVIAISDAELMDVDVDSDYTSPFNYNLVENPTVECLNGECDHFCGEPTQYDLERMERLGFADAVEAYESGQRLVLL